jgi:pyrroloquinoline-quinone synthase
VNLIAAIDAERAANNVLEHPFYERWSAGALTRSELACYAGEYRHAVAALARASESAAAQAEQRDAAQLREHAREERAHVELWEGFARAAGADPVRSDVALAATADCARAWEAGGDLVEHLAVLYAIEASQPEIARTKLEGLVEHYGYEPEGPAVEYFAVHMHRDLEHAREAQELIGALIRDASAAREARFARELCQRALAHARAALRGNWSLLDGVEAAASA